MTLPTKFAKDEDIPKDFVKIGEDKDWAYAVPRKVKEMWDLENKDPEAAAALRRKRLLPG